MRVSLFALQTSMRQIQTGKRERVKKRNEEKTVIKPKASNESPFAVRQSTISDWTGYLMTSMSVCPIYPPCKYCAIHIIWMWNALFYHEATVMMACQSDSATEGEEATAPPAMVTCTKTFSRKSVWGTSKEPVFNVHFLFVHHYLQIFHEKEGEKKHYEMKRSTPRVRGCKCSHRLGQGNGWTQFYK